MSEIALSLRDPRGPSFVGRLSSDEHLARMASRGSTRAFAVLYERYHQSLFRYCRSIVRQPEDARDALQSTMMRAFAALCASERDLAVRPWLFRIAHNESISILRRRRADESIVPEEQPGGFDVESTVDQRERLTLLVSDLQTLVERQRAALVMRELNGLSIEEIAAALSCSPGAAKQALFEARTALHEMSEGRGMECEVIREAISDRDGRVLRGRKLRAHLRACAGCREFEAAIGARRADLRALAPPLPTAAGIALLRSLLASSGHTGNGVAAMAAHHNAGGTAVAGTNGSSAALTGAGPAGPGVAGTSAGIGATGAGVTGTSTGGAMLGGHLMGSLAAKALVGVAVVAMAATGVTHLALGPAHSRHQAALHRGTNSPDGHRAATRAQRAPLAAPKWELPSSSHKKVRAAGIVGPLGAASGRHSSHAFGRSRSMGTRGGSPHGSPVSDSTGRAHAVERRSGAAIPHGHVHRHRSRSPSSSEKQLGSASSEEHSGDRDDRHSGKSPEIGKAKAKAPPPRQLTGTTGASSPRPHPSNGSSSERTVARARPQPARSSSP